MATQAAGGGGAAGGGIGIIIDEDRLLHAARHPRRVDHATVAALLAQSRHLEDTIGSEPMIPGTLAHLRVIENLAADAHGHVRRHLVDVAAQWAHFAGWLHTSTGQADSGKAYYERALAWATETGNVNLHSEVLSMKGQLAWTFGRGDRPSVCPRQRSATDEDSPGNSLSPRHKRDAGMP